MNHYKDLIGRHAYPVDDLIRIAASGERLCELVTDHLHSDAMRVPGRGNPVDDYTLAALEELSRLFSRKSGLPIFLGVIMSSNRDGEDASDLNDKIHTMEGIVNRCEDYGVIQRALDIRKDGRTSEKMISVVQAYGDFEGRIGAMRQVSKIRTDFKNMDMTRLELISKTLWRSYNLACITHIREAELTLAPPVGQPGYTNSVNMLNNNLYKIKKRVETMVDKGETLVKTIFSRAERGPNYDKAPNVSPGVKLNVKKSIDKDPFAVYMRD